MDSARASKRRRLDTPEKGGSKSSPAQRPTGTPKNAPEKTSSSRREQAATTGSRTISGTHESWQQAKAKAQENRGKRVGSTPQKAKKVDVYDDIEGAHSGRSRLAPLANLGSTPKTKQLDPLRNQVASSPAANSPSKANAGLSFFKKFTKPREEDETSKGPEKCTVNGDGHNAEAEDGEDEESVQEGEKSTPISQNGKGAWKSWAYADKSKKTFEDEIRDLEKAARENAGNEDGGGTTERASLRRRGRQSATPVVVPKKAEPATSTKAGPRATPKPVKDLKWKVHDPEYSTKARDVKSDVVPKDRMEIDSVENDFEHQLQEETGSAPPTVTPFKQKLQQPTKKKAPDSVKNVSFEPRHLQTIKTILLEKLTGKRPTRLVNLEDEYAKVANMVAQTVTAGESNSLLLIGSRSSGKTTMINQILREQAVTHPNDFLVVRLSGFVHTDDKIALREIWRQLGREMELDEEESNLKNYADTLTSLLALLSHPAEQGREQPDQVTKSVIFILDEFELFASHPRQTLLYNLFDVAQSRKAPITVLGLTTRIDVAESLEKRVKSRFSHRYVHLSSAKSFVAFHEACKIALAFQPEDLTEDEKMLLTVAVPSVVNTTGRPTETKLDQWNNFVDTLFAQEETAAQLRHVYYTTKSIPDFHSSMLLPISTLPSDSPTSASDLLTHLTSSSALSPPDSKLTLLASLSSLQLALLICAARLTAIHAQDTIPFIHAYEEYKTIASKARIQASASGVPAARIWSKAVAQGAWEELVTMGLVMEDGVRGGRVDVGLEEIGMSGIELGSWGRWCREI